MALGNCPHHSFHQSKKRAINYSALQLHTVLVRFQYFCLACGFPHRPVPVVYNYKMSIRPQSMIDIFSREESDNIDTREPGTENCGKVHANRTSGEWSELKYRLI